MHNDNTDTQASEKKAFLISTSCSQTTSFICRNIYLIMSLDIIFPLKYFSKGNSNDFKTQL